MSHRLHRFRAPRRALFMLALLPLIGAAPARTASAQDVKAGPLTITSPWARATPGGAAVAAGYLSIGNAGDDPDRLVSATTVVAGRVSAHEMGMKDGAMTMRALPEGIVVPPHDSVVLKPGGIHLMLEDLRRPLRKGEVFAGTLTFAKAGTVAVVFTVEAVGAKAPAAGAKAPAAGAKAPATDADSMPGMTMD